MADETAMQARVTKVASWVLFAIALALAALTSFLLLYGEAIWGAQQVVFAGPGFVLLLIYLLLMPLVFGTVGLFKTTPRRRLIAGAVMLVSLGAYMFVAAGRSFDWF